MMTRQRYLALPCSFRADMSHSQERWRRARMRLARGNGTVSSRAGATCRARATRCACALKEVCHGPRSSITDDLHQPPRMHMAPRIGTEGSHSSPRVVHVQPVGRAPCEGLPWMVFFNRTWTSRRAKEACDGRRSGPVGPRYSGQVAYVQLMRCNVAVTSIPHSLGVPGRSRVSRICRRHLCFAARHHTTSQCLCAYAPTEAIWRGCTCTTAGRLRRRRRAASNWLNSPATSRNRRSSLLHVRRLRSDTQWSKDVQASAGRMSATTQNPWPTW